MNRVRDIFSLCYFVLFVAGFFTACKDDDVIPEQIVGESSLIGFATKECGFEKGTRGVGVVDDSNIDDISVYGKVDLKDGNGWKPLFGGEDKEFGNSDVTTLTKDASSESGWEYD